LKQEILYKYKYSCVKHHLEDIIEPKVPAIKM
jgi:hypothetical protein